MPKKSSKKKPLAGRRYGHSVPTYKNIDDFLSDVNAMSKMEDLVCSGASIGTVESCLHLSKNRLKLWLQRGQTRKRSSYYILFQKYRAWAGEARAAAECQQLAKAPSAWIEKNTSSRIVEDVEESPALLPTNISQSPTALLQLGAQQALNAMKVLIDAGISIDDSLRKDQITIDTPSLPSPTDTLPTTQPPTYSDPDEDE